MAENENRESQDNDLDILVRAQQAKAGGLSARQALTIMVDQLGTSQGYYTWSSLGTGKDAVWIIRFPRMDLDDEAWLRDESADMLHICQPLQYVEAVERKDKEASSKYVGYVRDLDGELVDRAEFKCMKCKRKMPKKQQLSAKAQMTIHKIGRKVR